MKQLQVFIDALADATTLKDSAWKLRMIEDVVSSTLNEPRKLQLIQRILKAR